MTISVKNRLGLEFKVDAVGDVGVVVTRGGKSVALPLSVHRFNQRFLAWTFGMKIQNAFPELTPSQREFLMTGLVDDELIDRSRN